MDVPAGTLGGGHIHEELLELYAMNRLGEPKLGEVEEHLLLCERCQDRLEEIDGFVKVFLQASRQLDGTTAAEAEKGEPSRLWAWLKPVWAAAAAVAAVLVVALVVPRNPEVGAVQTIQLRGIRGSTAVAVAHAGQPIELHLDLTGLDTATRHRVELVSSSGNVIWKRDARTGSGSVTVEAPAMTAGSYWVRLVTARGETEREFGLRVK